MTDAKLEDAGRVADECRRSGLIAHTGGYHDTAETYFLASALLRRIPELHQQLVDALGLIAVHNAAVSELCGPGDQEGVACGYRPYFPRRCPECPKRNWTIEP